MSSDHNDDAARVGYGSPPRWPRWRKGQSGNPGGRPKKSKQSIQTIVENELDRMVEAKENGKIVYRPARQLLVRAMIAKAAKGDVRAMNWLLKHCPDDIFNDGPLEVTLVFEEEEERARLRAANSSTEQ